MQYSSYYDFHAQRNAPPTNDVQLACYRDPGGAENQAWMVGRPSRIVDVESRITTRKVLNIVTHPGNGVRAIKHSEGLM
jgi:hypothetical protein